MTRTGAASRKTLETEVRVDIALDGSGTTSVTTGVGFFDHLLASFAHHSLMDLTVETSGDTHVDDHHTIEDTCLAIGAAIGDALADRSGIVRFGSATVPMDEAIATAAVDLGGRTYVETSVALRGHRLGDMSTQMVEHAIDSLARTAGATIHVSASGRNDHHMAEATFKALALAIRQAVAIDPRRSGVASTKGALGSS